MLSGYKAGFALSPADTPCVMGMRLLGRGPSAPDHTAGAYIRFGSVLQRHHPTKQAFSVNAGPGRQTQPWNGGWSRWGDRRVPLAFRPGVPFGGDMLGAPGFHAAAPGP